MSRGAHLSLEEARKEGKLDRFAKEQPSEGDEPTFKRLFLRMASGEEPPEPPKDMKEKWRI